jgi:small-conductance mechanosensitive channel
MDVSIEIWTKLCLVWFAALGAAALLWRLRRALGERLRRNQDGPGIRFRGHEVLPRRPIIEAADGLLGAGMALAVAGLLYAALYDSLSRFESTRPLAQRLLSYALEPLARGFQAALDYTPKAIFIVLACLLTWGVLKALRMAFGRLESGFIHIQDFPAEWAQPSYKIARALVLGLAAVVIWPYLPAAESAAFKGASLFVGVLISLSSSSAIANLIAGIILTYTRAFTLGDRIVVAGTEGTVVARSLLATRLRNAYNVVITVPNAKLMAEPIHNLGGASPQAPLMLSTAVGIGYNVPWTKVHALLLAAAEGQSGVLAQPAAKVWQRELGDFSVRYELCFSTERPAEKEAILSAVHAAIQDRFAEAGIEILSPDYYAKRDGNASTVPPRA